jgi:isoleucyl-tRNA synthetase
MSERGLGGEVSDSSARPEALEGRAAGAGERSELDRWALSELNQLVAAVTRDFEGYDSMTATRRIEDFVEALSNWYVRRSRRRFWKSEDDGDKRAAYETLYTCLQTLNLLLAPIMPFVAEDIYQNLVRSWNPDAPESVHLCDWPAANEALIDEELSASVRLIQRLASLGRSARSKANVRVRQPLARVHVKTASERERATVLALAEQLLEELNVKELSLATEDVDFLKYHVRPNLPILGPKYGQQVARIQQSLAKDDAAVHASYAREIAAGNPIVVDEFELQPEELLVSTESEPGYAVAEEAGYAVAVTTGITPELADEGLARELVRRIQEMRKSAGFEIADRIRLGYEGDPEVARVIEAWRDYIAQETLTEAFLPSATSGYIEEHNIDGRSVKLAVERLT